MDDHSDEDRTRNEFENDHDGCRGFRRDLQYLRSECLEWLETSKFHDAEFVCSDGSTFLHRFILASVSPLLREALNEDDEVSTVVLPDFTVRQLRKLAVKAYGGSIEEEEEEEEEDDESTLELADCLRIGELREEPPEGIHVKTELYYDSDDEVEKPKRFEKLPRKGGWKCLTCGSVLRSLNAFNVHFAKFHATSGSRLPEVKVVDARVDRRRCVLIKGNGWQCRLCKVYLDDLRSFHDHWKSCCGSDDKMPESLVLQCTGCRVKFEDEYALQDHSCSETFNCDICAIAFKDELAYKVHNSVHHCRAYGTTGREGDTSPIPYDLLVKEEEDVKSKPINPKRKRDPRVPHEYKCSLCPLSFKNKFALCYHKVQHSEDRLSCPQCKRKFKSIRGLKYHINKHEGIADYLCHDCGARFITRQKLMNHRRARHTFERPYICDQCGEAFVRSDKLVVHRRRVHTGEKPYQCEFCEWRGVDSSSLIHHRKKHTNERERLAASKAKKAAAAAAAVADDLASPPPMLHHPHLEAPANGFPIPKFQQELLERSNASSILNRLEAVRQLTGEFMNVD